MQLSDQEFLAKVVELYKLIYSEDLVLLIDISNKLLHLGKGILKLFPQLSNQVSDQLINKNFLDVIPIPPENIAGIQASIEKVIQSKTSQEFLSINLNHSYEYIILNSIQKPIINPATGNVVTISVMSRKLDFQIYLYKLLPILYTNKSGISNNIPHTDELLTLREHEIAFLLFYCKSAKNIALILNNIYDKPVTAKTISNIISGTLYPKFSVYNIEALIERLFALGYHKKLPVSFIINVHLDLS